MVLMVFFSSRISPLTSTVIFFDKIAGGDGRCDLGDIAHLACQVAGHEVHAVRQILPRTGDTFHLRLTAQPAFGTHFAGHARDF